MASNPYGRAPAWARGRKAAKPAADDAWDRALYGSAESSPAAPAAEGSGLVRQLSSKPLEADLEAWGVRAAAAAGGRAYKFSSPGRRSVPDRILLFPGGRMAFVEWKRPGGKPTAKQLAEHAYLRSLGFEVYVCDSKEQFLRVLETLTTGHSV